ncbi:MAG: complex I subunit 5 family protein [Candidatus Nanohalobium sp.]
MNQYLILPFIVPLFTAILSIIFRKTKLRDYIAVGGSLFYLGAVIALTQAVIRSGQLVYQAGGWAAPYGITLTADALSVFMLLMTSIVSLAGVIYSSSYIEELGKESGYYAFFHFMLAGMSGAFITGDLFNLFVMFEIVLMSSYAMVSYSGTDSSLFTSMKYVVLNLIGSSLMLVAIGGLYSVTGTLNMADLAVVLSSGSVNTVPVLGLTSVLFCVFAIKSGLVPFHFWAPPVYSESPPPAAAMMAGISKKVGIYAVIRLYITIFSTVKIPQTAVLFADNPLTTVIGGLIAVMASATIILGGTSAVNRNKLDKMLSYSSIGQVGFIFIPIAITMFTGSKTALLASLIYILGHGVAKSSLFMISGMIQKIAGTTDLEELGGLSEKSFLISASYFIAAFSLVGIPPLVGFFAKFMVFKTAVSYGSLGLVAVLLFGALTTLLYFGKSWLKAFFGEPVELDLSEVTRREPLSVVFLTSVILLLGVGFEPVYQLAERAAAAALDSQGYIDTVLGDKQ